MLPRLHNRLKHNIDRVAPEVVKMYAGYSTGNVVDAMGKLGGAMDYQIKPLKQDWWFCGPAVTVKCRPVDNALEYKAIEICQPGDVLVITNFKNHTHSMWGDILGRIAKKRGIAGVVGDGLVRDIPGIIAVGLPVFACGSTPNSVFKNGPGEVNYPISCGDVVVEPGDLVMGDCDGVVVVPKAYAREVAEKLPAIAAREERIIAEIEKEDRFIIPDWMQDSIHAIELDIED